MHPVTSNAVADALAGISNTLNGLSSRISSIANDVAGLQSAINNSGGGSGSGSGGDEGESSILYYHSNSPYLSGTIVDAATEDLGRSFDGMNINNSVSGSWMQISEAVSVPSAGSGSGSGRPTWKAHFREVS